MLLSFVQRGAVAFAVFAVSAAPALADTGWTPDAAATWSIRTMHMATIPLDGGQGGLDMASALGDVCDGVSGEQRNHEWGKAPLWAVTSQADICSAYAGWARKFMGSKAMCRTMERGLSRLDGMNEATDPPEVVAATKKLRETGQAVLASAKANHACKR